MTTQDCRILGAAEWIIEASDRVNMRGLLGAEPGGIFFEGGGFRGSVMVRPWAMRASSSAGSAAGQTSPGLGCTFGGNEPYLGRVCEVLVELMGEDWLREKLTARADGSLPG